MLKQIITTLIMSTLKAVIEKLPHTVTKLMVGILQSKCSGDKKDLFPVHC